MQVVALLEGGADLAEIADATIEAAERGLALAATDPGLIETFWLLTQLPAAARSENFIASLQGVGLDVSSKPTLMDLLGAFTDAIDAKVFGKRGRTDLGEMAEMAGVETISKMIGTKTQSLFGTSTDDLQSALASLGTKSKFSAFAREFFARLTERCISYFLSRAYANHTGEGRRFSTLNEQANFAEALNLHCREASAIVEGFSGGWFTKTNWEKKGIARQDVAGFAGVAMQKIYSELKIGAQPDGD